MIPTYDPNLEIFGKVLDALRCQTMPLHEWELIVIDNGSSAPLADRLDLNWHPNGRCILEERRGVYHARTRGLRECRGDITIGVDDDNILATNYLVEALRIGKEWPALGVWGGQIKPAWEVAPSEEVLPWVQHLALCEFKAPTWSSFVHDWTVPYGAGMCIRSDVVHAYLEESSSTAFSTRFGRNGRSMVSGEDQLIAYAATKMGRGVGKFPGLVLHHFIPKQRIRPDYLVQAARGNAHAALLLQLLHKTAEQRLSTRLWPAFKLLAGAFLHGMRRRMVWAEALGQLDALREVSSFRRELRDDPVSFRPAFLPN